MQCFFSTTKHSMERKWTFEKLEVVFERAGLADKTETSGRHKRVNVCSSYLLCIIFLGMAWNGRQIKTVGDFVEINGKKTLSFQSMYLWAIIWYFDTELIHTPVFLIPRAKNWCWLQFLSLAPGWGHKWAHYAVCLLHLSTSSSGMQCLAGWFFMCQSNVFFFSFPLTGIALFH